MLWYLQEPYQWDSSFEHPKHTLNIMGMTILTILRKKFCVSKPMVLISNSCIHNYHWRFIAGYMVGNLIFWRRVNRAVKRDFLAEYIYEDVRHNGSF